MAKVVASIEARMSSSRLPGKALMEIGGVPSLTRLLRRLRNCQSIDEIVLATTDLPIDDSLANWAEIENVAIYRGNESDVLGRVVEAQQYMASDIVVEINGDCPLLDPAIVDLGIETFVNNQCDVVTNSRIPSYPQGLDVQVFRLKDLQEVAKREFDSAVREHVSLYFYEHPERYNIFNLVALRSMQDPEVRLQIDYEEDLNLVRKIYSALEPVYGDNFGVVEILDLLKREPLLRKINAHCKERPAR